MPTHWTVPARTACFVALTCAVGLALRTAGARSSETSAPPGLARMERIEGDVAVIRGGRPSPLVRGHAILRHDRIRTAQGARAAIVFPDGSRLLMGGGAETLIEDYLPEDGRQRAVILLDVPRGPVRLLLSKPQHGTTKKASIRSAAMTVTPAPSQHMIDVWTGPVEGATGVLAIVGRVNVRNAAGSLTLDKKRQGTFVSGPATSPELPTVWPRPRVEQALASVE